VDRIELAFPCTADFARMQKVDGGRFCGDCAKVVHDLSAMTEGEVRALLARTPTERVCVRYVYDASSGRLVLGHEAEDRARLVPAHRLAARILGRVALAAAVAAPLLVEACGGAPGDYDYSLGSPSLQRDAGSDADSAARDAGRAEDGAINTARDAASE
jgi:hypothetical protein